MYRFCSTIVFATAMLAAPAATTQPLHGEEAFAFVAMGDLPYHRRARDAQFQRLLDVINAARPDFVIHVGDFKSGSSLCTDERFALERDVMDGLGGAVIYTPGDNDWTDCHRANNGGYDPSERLATLRSMFFADDRSLGRQPITLTRQPSLDSGAPTPENALWWHNDFAFATVHVVGSNNNFADPAEFAERDAANTAWIVRVFDTAAAADSPAVVLALHADLFERSSSREGFRSIIAAISDGARAFGGPVLLIHGDSHRFTVDQAFMDRRPDLDNVVRLQVFGDAEMHAVRVVVDPSMPGLFAFQPLIVPGNTRARRGG